MIVDLTKLTPLDFAKQKLVFVHIPKCGGTSMHTLLENLFEGKYSHVRPGGDWESQLGVVNGVGGHQNYGSDPLTKYYSADNDMEMVYISMMREPFARYLSFYNHIQRRPGHHLATRYPELINMPPLEFAEFLFTKEKQSIANVQCQMLAGAGVEIATAELAVQNFEAFKIITTLEYIDVFSSILSKLSGKSFEPIPKRNRGNYLDGVDYDPIQLRRYINTICSEDLKLYYIIESWTRKLIS